MTQIAAVVKNRLIEVPAPEDLPDGTHVIVLVQDSNAVAEGTPCDGVDESDTSPEGVRKWIEWSERPKPEPSQYEELRAILASNRAFQKQWELDHRDEHDEKLRRMFE